MPDPLDAFLRQELAEAELNREHNGGYSSVIWTQRVVDVMVEQGYLEAGVQVFSAPLVVQIRNATGRLDGWHSSESGTLDLIVTDFTVGDEVQQVAGQEVLRLRDECVRLLKAALKVGTGSLGQRIEESHDAAEFVSILPTTFKDIVSVRVWLLTTRRSAGRSAAVVDVDGKDVGFEVMDLARLHRLVSGGRGQEELAVNLADVVPGGVPCLYVPARTGDDGDPIEPFDVVMTVIPAEVLYQLYRSYGERLLEANVRSFLSAKGGVNRGIRDTLRKEPGRFLAYNNGLVMVADEAEVVEGREGQGRCLVGLRGMQIVNGGQTTASIYFDAREKKTDLSAVRVPAKILVLNQGLGVERNELLIGKVSKFANSQNSVSSSDLSARDPYHLELEKHANTTFIPQYDPYLVPQGVAPPSQLLSEARWFYERAAGSYETVLRRVESPARRRQTAQWIIPRDRLVKKTELGKYVMAWEARPEIVSKGNQKCFSIWMSKVAATGGGLDGDDAVGAGLPSQADFKRYMAMAIVYRRVEDIIKPLFTSYRGNIAPYTVGVLAHQLVPKLDLMKVWNRQGLSDPLRELVRVWSRVVNQVMRESAGDRNISEWAKKEECWAAVRAATYPMPAPGSIPELS